MDQSKVTFLACDRGRHARDTGRMTGRQCLGQTVVETGRFARAKPPPGPRRWKDSPVRLVPERVTLRCACSCHG